MKLTIIIPVYNEDRQLLELLDRVEAIPISKEIIVADDGSTNGLFQEIGDRLVKRALTFGYRSDQMSILEARKKEPMK